MCAFYGCSRLNSVIISNNVISINDYAFGACYNLNNVYYLGTPDEWNNITILKYNYYLSNAARYYYSEEEPTDTTYNYWHYVDGVPIKWEI